MKTTKNIFRVILGTSLLIFFASCATNNSLASNKRIINLDENPNAEIAIVRNWCNEKVKITCLDSQWNNDKNDRTYNVLWEGELNPKETLSLGFNTFIRNTDEDKNADKGKRFVPGYRRSKIVIRTQSDGWAQNYTYCKDTIVQYRLVDSGNLIPLKDGKFKSE